MTGKTVFLCVFFVLATLFGSALARTAGTDVFITTIPASSTSATEGMYLGISTRGVISSNGAVPAGTFNFPSNADDTIQTRVGLMLVAPGPRNAGDFVISNEVESRFALASTDDLSVAFAAPTGINGIELAGPGPITVELVADKVAASRVRTAPDIFGTRLQISKRWDCDTISVDGCLFSVSVYNPTITASSKPLTYTESCDPDIDAYLNSFESLFCFTDNNVDRRIVPTTGAPYSRVYAYGRNDPNRNVFVQFLTFDMRINPGTANAVRPLVNEIYESVSIDTIGDSSIGLGALLGTLLPGQQAQFTYVFTSKEQAGEPNNQLTCDMRIFPTESRIDCRGSGLTFDYEPFLLDFIKNDGGAVGPSGGCATLNIIHDYSEIKSNLITPSTSPRTRSQPNINANYYDSINYAPFAIPNKFFGYTSSATVSVQPALTGTYTFCYGPESGFETDAAINCDNGIALSFEFSNGLLRYCFAYQGQSSCANFPYNLTPTSALNIALFFRISIAKTGIFADVIVDRIQTNPLFLADRNFDAIASTWVYGLITSSTSLGSFPASNVAYNLIGLVAERAPSRTVGFSLLYTASGTGFNVTGPAHTGTFRVDRSITPNINCPTPSPFNTAASLGPSCGTTPFTYASPVASDACFDSIPVYQVNGPVPGSDWTIPPTPAFTMPYSATAQWAVNGFNGNAVTCNVALTMVDIDDPVFSDQGDGTCALAIDPNFNECGTSVTINFQPNDFCDTSPTIDYGTYVPGTFLAANQVYTYTITATDDSGNSDSCVTSVTVRPVGIEDPICSSYGSRDTDPGVCTYTLTHTDVINNPNPCTLSTSPAPGSTHVYNLQDDPHIITYTVSSNGTSETVSCTKSLLVVDNEDPTIDCPDDISTTTDAGVCYAVVNYTPPSPADNCPDPTSSRTAGLDSGSQFPTATTTISYSVTDASSNAGDPCSFTVTVTDDESPTIDGPDSITQTTESTTCNKVITYTVTPSDNCGVDTFTNDNSNAESGDTFSKGTHTITYTATDDAGNSATHTISITVNDETDPVITSTPSAETFYVGVNCKYTYGEGDFGSCTATDNCPTITCTGATIPATGDALDPGTYTITWTAEDDSGNTATSSTVFTVADEIDPTFNCQPITLTVDGTCNAAVDLSSNDADDNCGATTTYQIAGSPAPATIGVGIYTVSASASDASGNTASCTFTLTVNDPGAVITCPDADTFEVGTGCVASITDVDDATITGCGTFTQTNDFTAGNYGLGPFTVTYEIVGDPSKTCSVTNTVQDTTDPTASCASTTTLSADSSCEASYTFPSNINGQFSDFCSPTATADDFPAGPFGVGTVTQTWTVTDSSDNSATCVITLVVEDDTDPTITCPTAPASPIPSEVGFCGAVVSATPTASDNCDTPSTSRSPAAANRLAPGTHTLTWTATDDSDNSATCSYSVTISTPSITITCSTQEYVNAAALCQGTPPAPTVSHDCAYTVSPSSPGSFAIGDRSASYTATSSANGNPTDTCTHSFTVVDNTPPTFACPPSVTLTAGTSSCTSTGTPTSPSAVDTCSGPVSVQLISNNLVSNGNLDRDCTAFSSTLAVPTAMGWTGVNALIPLAYDVEAHTGLCATDFGATPGDNFVPVSFTSTPGSTYTISAMVHCVRASPCDFSIRDNTGVTTLVSRDNVPMSSGWMLITTTLTTIGSLGQFRIYTDGDALVDTVTAIPVLPIVYSTGSTVEWVGYDTQGNAAFCSSSVLIDDDTGPSGTCPSSASINTDLDSCTATYTYATFTTNDNCDSTPTITPTGTTTLAVGAHTITYTITDDGGNTGSCTASVTVSDAQSPSAVTCDSTTTATADASCLGTFGITPQDNCAVSSVSATLGGTSTTVSTSGSSRTVQAGSGQTLVWTIMDTNGNSGTCTQTTSLTDAIPPTISGCPTTPVTRTVNPSNCKATADYTGITGSDNCGTPALVFSPLSGSDLSIGTTTATVTATDGAGNSDTCTFNFVVSAPSLTVTCPATTKAVNADSSCQYSFVPDTLIVDSTCDTTTTITTGGSTITAGHSFGVGTHTVIYTVAVDGDSSTSQTCTVAITVSDNQGPTISCPANAPFNADSDCAGDIPVGSPTTSDNCGVASVTHAPTTYNTKGATTVTFTATDVNGNSATCNTVYTAVDVTPPTFPSGCGNVFASSYNADAGQCSVAINPSNPSASDACGGSPAVTRSPSSPYAVGTQTVTFTATDADGNAGTCQDTFTVLDTQDPTITCPASATYSVEACTRVTTYTTPTATDNCPSTLGAPSLTTGLLSGSEFPVGTTTVTWGVTDGSGNTDSCSFTITIIDTRPPNIACPASMTFDSIQNRCGFLVNYPTPTASDPCEEATVQFISGVFPGTFAPVGVHPTTWKVIDGSGTETLCQFTVTIVDKSAPTFSCPANINTFVEAGTCKRKVNYPSATVNDDCGRPTVSLVSGLASGSDFPVGTSSVTLRASDGVSSVSCTFTVKVVDNINPSITCDQPEPVGTSSTGCGAVVTFDTATGSDNCDEIVSLTSGNPSGFFFPVGRSVTTFTVTDPSGNFASCSTFIDVADDDPPVVTCRSPISVSLDATNNYRRVLTEGDIVVSKSDNCAIFSTAISLTVIDFNTFLTSDSTTTTVTVTDRYGLRSTCTSTIDIARGKVLNIGSFVKRYYQKFTITWYNYGIFAPSSRVWLRIYNVQAYTPGTPFIREIATGIPYTPSPQNSPRQYTYNGISNVPCNVEYYVNIFIKQGTAAEVYVGQEPFYLAC